VGRFHRFRPYGSALTALAGFAALLYGLFASGLGTAEVLLLMLGGALLIFIGVALFSSHIVKPVARASSPVGIAALMLFFLFVFPFWIFPYWALRYAFFGPGRSPYRLAAFLAVLLNPIVGLVVLCMWLRALVSRWSPEWPIEFPTPDPDTQIAAIASANARRNPQRTASTAAALMIGLALVTLVGVLAAGIIETFKGAVNDLWKNADYAITAQNNFSPISVTAADAVAKADGVKAVGSVRTGEVAAFGKAIFATAVTPEASQMLASTGRRGRTSSSRSSAPTARSSTTATPTTITSRSARPSS
jgi:hypothetical protein